MESEVTNVQRELYFLIAKFLKSGPCQLASKALQDELEKHKIVQRRLDWEGDEHEQTFQEMERKYPHIGPRHLEEICCRLGPLLDKEIKPTVPGLKSLLGAGRQSLLRTKDIEKRLFKLVNFVARKNGIPVYSSLNIKTYNVVQALVGQSISGPACRHHLVTPQMYSKIRLLNRTLGHLSAVYCLLFDRSGRYIITGADDLLVKVWSVIDGRLLHSFRGASAEITDIDITLDNTLLAAGSLDKTIRVWCMQSGYPVATLSSHTGTITGVSFWPNTKEDYSYLVSTSSDGSVAFWSYSRIGGMSVFESKPLQYHEKLRPGQAQMLCSRFSAGGMFLATGSADHYVRVYKMDRDVPHRILEVEKHSDRVDSIQWANRGLKFVSGSKDGTAVVWCYQSQRWNVRHLLMTTTLNGSKSETEDNKIKLKVTMVCWSADDNFVITSVNDKTVKIWNPSSGELVNVLQIHKDVVYVLENHPFVPRVMLSAGHDGAVHLWDILSGEIYFSYQNHIEGQGNGAIFDAKWSPDGTMIAATDAHGHIIMFGISHLCEKMKDIPKELFFHTDYRPLVRDAITEQVIDEQTQVPPHLMPPPFLVDIEGNPYPPTFQRLVPGRENCSTEQLIPNIVFTLGGQQEVVDVGGDARPNIDDMIRALAGVPNGSPHSTVSPRSRPRGGEEGVRQSSGNWHRDGLDWKERVIITRLSLGTLVTSKKRVNMLGKLELEEYERESRRAPVVIPEASTLPANGKKQRRRHAPVYRTRAVRDQQLREQVHEVARDEAEYEQDTSPNQGDSSDVHSDDMSSESSTDSSSTEYSDWVADHGVNLEPPQRSRQRRAKKSPLAPPTRSPVKKAAPVNINAPSCSTAPIPVPLPPTEIPDSFKPSEWLSEVIPKKFPYYPQMGDEVMFFAQGYELYLKAVIMKRFYVLASTQYKPWGTLALNEPELVKIIGIKYELRPPRLCCLRLAVMKPNGKLTSDRFTIKYHDIPDVIDFFVLRQTYDIAMERQWKVGDRFRSMIDDGWWWGTIESRTKSNSMFLGYKIRWDNGESEAMSPWDMEPIDYSREPEVEGGSVPVLPEEIAAILYHPRGDEWPGGDRESACQRILVGLEEIMSLSVAEPFNAPVDTNVYPSYSYIVEFPTDISTIKARFENRFYRRVTAAQFDMRYLATNAEKFNDPHSSIVKQARIVTDLCLRMCKDYNVVDVPLLYRQLLEAYHSSASEPDEPRPSTSKEFSRQEKAAANRSLRAMNRAHQQQPDWRRDCRQLLDVLFNCQDSEPFREPVDRLEHPDYDKVIDTPMDLGTVREELLGGNYVNPIEFCKDVRMIFSNSRNFNTNKRSKIYVMTVRLAAMAEEHMKKIISNWKSSLRRLRRDDTKGSARRKPVARRRKKQQSQSESDNDSTSSSSEDEGDSDYNSKKSRQKVSKKKPLENYRKNFVGEPSTVKANGLRANKTLPPTKRSAPSSSSASSSATSDNTHEETTTLDVINGSSTSCFEVQASTTHIGPLPRKARNNGTQQKNFGPSKPGCSEVIGKRRVVAANNISYKERVNSSSSSSDDGPTKNWTMNGHIRVLRPVRRTAIPTPPENLGSKEDSESDDSSSHSSQQSEVKMPQTTTRPPVQNYSFRFTRNSVEADNERTNGRSSIRSLIISEPRNLRVSRAAVAQRKAIVDTNTSSSSDSDDVINGQAESSFTKMGSVFQKNGHASELSDNNDSEESSEMEIASNVDRLRDQSESSESEEEETVRQKVIVLKNPSAQPIRRGVKRRRPSDSDQGSSLDTGPRVLRSVKRMNYALQIDSDTENARPRRAQSTVLKYEEGSSESSRSSSLKTVRIRSSRSFVDNTESIESFNAVKRNTSRPVRIIQPSKSYADSSEESESEDEPLMTNKPVPARPTRATKTSKAYQDMSDNSFGGAPSRSARSRNSLKTNYYTNDDHSEDDSDSDEEDSTPSEPKVSISSRGRVRKITARARAFLRD